MNILLIGYGKMGKTIETLAKERQHHIVGKVNRYEELATINWSSVDVAIEFSQPDAAFQNITFCMDQKIPVLSGTTGWTERLDEIYAYCKSKDCTFLYASNFSIGVNILFEINEMLAKLMNKYPEYNLHIEETHHTQKKDAPSGTAITLAEGAIKHLDNKERYTLHAKEKDHDLPILSFREGDVVGEHKVLYQSAMDTIKITHQAHQRESFALGALLAAEWLCNKKGIFSIKDFLKSD